MSAIRISTVILAVSCTCSTSLGAQDLAFDVLAIAGKTPAEVQAVLGASEEGSPEGQHPWRNGERGALYTNDQDVL